MIEVNKTYTLKNNKKFTVVRPLGQGGQGQVFIAKLEGDTKEYAFKLIVEKNPETKRRKMQNIRALYLKKNMLINSLNDKNFYVALPLEIYEKGDDFGYIMNFLPGEDINHMMLENKFMTMPLNDKFLMINRISCAAEWLQKNGLCYQDFSHKNVMYTKDHHAVLIDCDNVASNSETSLGKTQTILGTGFYIAPEVAFKKHLPDIHSDQYALATLFYKIMTASTDSPYHGKELYTRPMRPDDMKSAAYYTQDDPSYGYNWLTYVFDPNNKVNEIVPTLYKKPDFQERQRNIIKLYKLVPDEMKRYFEDAFRDPLNLASRLKRPAASMWRTLTENLLNGKKDTEVKVDTKKKEETSKKENEMNKGVTKNAPHILILATKVSIPLKDTFDVNPMNTNNGIRMMMGTITKKENGYFFKSSSPYLISYEDPGKKGNIKYQEEIRLTNKFILYFANRITEKIQIILE